MTFREELHRRAGDLGRRVVLAEAGEERVREAARLIEGRIGQVVAIDHAASDHRRRAVADLLHERTGGALTTAEIERLVGDPVWLAAGLVATGQADCAVAGAACPTANVIRAALRLIGPAPGTTRISSAFYMIVPWGSGERVLTFTDAGVNPDPDAVEMAEIARAAAHDRRYIVGDEPVVAFLSYSTKGSADGPRVDKVRMAAEQFQAVEPDIVADGELQADAALVPSIAEQKAPGSAVRGNANVLVFPDLDSGNIAYKLVNRLAGGTAIGPILQGLAKPVADVSRGASPSDIADVAAVAVLQAARLNR
jgi:phosphate acetyltransferase